MTVLIQAVFWLAVLAVVYAYAGFPLLVIAAGAVLRRRVRKRRITPRISLIIAAYNEERDIAARLDNISSLDYPREELQVIVASDGSSDRTDEIVNSYADRGVTLLQLPRKGKIHALNAAVTTATGDIVVFSDANAMYGRDSLRKLAANFADEFVGGVAGNTGYRLQAKSESSSRGEDLYWQYDTWLKSMESLTGNVVSAHGGIYAIRRALYRPVEDGSVTDDFAISTSVIEQGYRLVFEPEARSCEVAVPKATREFQRRVRLMTRGWRSLLLRRRLLNPLNYGFYSVVLWSHKVLRRLIPVPLAAILVSSAWLAASSSFYASVAALQAIFYALAVAGLLLRRTQFGASRVFYIPFFYCLANIAATFALVRAIAGRRIELWQPQRNLN